ncbi:MAG TPA: hypothetical protein VLM89_02980 [Phycisphaerae bacterium]|nr:hypothetical protein [Phycisphaerae bacterium]
MKLGSIWRKGLRGKVCALVSAGSLWAVVAGCDPQVQNALVQGLGAAAVATLEAMFTRDETPSQPGVPTVPTVMNKTGFDWMSA